MRLEKLSNMASHASPLVIKLLFQYAVGNVVLMFYKNMPPSKLMRPTNLNMGLDPCILGPIHKRKFATEHF